MFLLVFYAICKLCKSFIEKNWKKVENPNLYSIELRPCWYQISNNTCYIPKVSKLYVENNIYVNRLASITSLVCKWHFMDYKIMQRGGGPDGTEF